ncbi:MAG: N-glycosylase/DNA lyase [Candidatus Aenigmarchaeota archaeon]|nr:N-glycosylase/DNA lyase [Candidatus Aenigmarchaeota archaeon]
MEEIRKLYEGKKTDIRKRLDEFKSVSDQTDEKLFAELAFCILTPQSKATICWNVIKSLEKNSLLFTGDYDEIRPFLNAVRFGNNKTGYLIGARKFFTENGRIVIKKKLSQFKDPISLRGWIVENVKGIGMKESSHFIRNIGLSENQLAILDTHILRNLEKFDVIEQVPKSLTKNLYLDIEEKMKRFAGKMEIPLDELDLLLWSKETGFIFK